MKWEKVLLGDIASIIRGITFKPSDIIPIEETDAVVCLRTKNVQIQLDESDLIAVPSRFVRNEKQHLREGDILVSSANSWNLVGKCCWVGELKYKATAGGFISVLRGNEKRISARYLYHWFSSPNVQTLVRSLARQTTNISNLNISRCLQIELLLPPLLEQRRIAAILDKADSLRTKRQEAIAKLDELLQSVFIDMFGDPMTNPKGWPVGKLGERIIKGPQNGLYKPSSDYGDGTPILRIDSFYDGAITGSEQLKRVRLEASEKALYSLNENDIVINRVNSLSHLGKSAIVPKLSEVTVFESNMMRMSFDTKYINPSFIIHYLQSGYIKNQILGCAKNAVNQSSINQKDIKGFIYFEPPLELQNTFASRVQKIHEMELAMISTAMKADIMFQSLQQRAFTGELFPEESATSTQPHLEVAQHV